MVDNVTTFECTMTCQEPDRLNPGQLIHTAELTPVPGDIDNDKVYANTPLGTLRFLSLKDGAFFVAGSQYKVTISG